MLHPRYIKTRLQQLFLRFLRSLSLLPRLVLVIVPRLLLNVFKINTGPFLGGKPPTNVKSFLRVFSSKYHSNTVFFSKFNVPMLMSAPSPYSDCGAYDIRAKQVVFSHPEMSEVELHLAQIYFRSQMHQPGGINVAVFTFLCPCVILSKNNK